MICPLCKQGELTSDKVTVTLERNSSTVVFKDVPADVCNNCGEEYVDETVTEKLLNSFNEAVRDGIVVEVRHFIAA